MKSLTLTRPHLIITMGTPGSGKTTFAEHFASMFNAPYVCAHKLQMPEQADQSKTRTILYYQLGELLKTKQTIIVDIDTHSKTERAELSKLAKLSGYATLFVWVQIDQKTSRNRFIRQGKTVEDKQYLADLHAKLASRFTPPNTNENVVVISGKHTYASQAKIVLTRLSEPRISLASQPAPVPTRPSVGGRRIVTIG